jgi:preprotein translocase subunit SecA
MLGLLKKLVGGKHEKDIRILRPIVDEVNRFFQEYQGLTDEQLRAKTDEFRTRIQEGTKQSAETLSGLREQLHGDITPAEKEKIHADIDQAEQDYEADFANVLDDLLPEAFAAVKDALALVGQSFDLMGHPAASTWFP